MRKLLILTCCIALLVTTGCELDESDTSTETTDTTTDTTTDEPSVAAISWLGPNLSGATVDGTLNSVSVSGGYITLDYSVEWSSAVPSGMSTEMIGMVCMFRYINGTLTGGKFEWVQPGQTLKLTDNIESGYNGHTVPSSGETVYFCMADVDGTKRTPLVSTTW